MLEVNQIHKSYHAPSGEVPVLKGVNFSMQKGEFVAIVGESGSGKSTLLQVVGTLDVADSGSVKLDGESLLDMQAKQQAAVRNRKIGFVYQAHHLIPELTALENVALPLLIRGEKREAYERAEALLERLGLQERLRHVPSRLSGGEAQRVAVARALVGRPRLLLADEPTGNLDEKTAAEVFDAMRELCAEEGAAVAMVTHSEKLAQLSDRCLMLKAGIIEESIR